MTEKNDAQVLDLPCVFERVCVEMGATHKNMHGWTGHSPTNR